ncbi:uncharacterized protein LOC129408950 isoform X1 [Boleophthalmus pectinirostris]|uniref:uncharacterized protein LOC129408950 isoform X1 n=1 Tax=Boleophthalmus pectinirostris TaxID=150288 RepID=UPI00242BA556|nr:uncharacterized protein LOC129408950 isoform X1 [Boleophthalmus pectinirostris]
MVTVVETLLPLILICSHAFADSVSSIMASRGDRVNLTCSTPNIRITQVNWSRGKYHYAFNDNKTSSNFSDTFVIDPKFPPSLSILDFQQNDTGIYKCVVTNKKGLETTIWNVTLTEKDQTKGVSVILLSGIFIYISTMGGLLICSSAVCLCIFWRTSNQHEGQSQTDGALQTAMQSGEQGRPLDGAVDQYVERVNSIYEL